MALEEGSGVLVERYIPGTEHRLLVVGGRLVAANRGDSVSVTGDGKSTIRELIRDQINSDPRRGETEDHPLNLISMDGVTIMEIARQGFAVDSIPPAGLEVLIQRNGNHAFDVTDEVHPSTAAAASLAARIVGLDIAGIDLVVRNISRPLAEQGGAIVEVNAGPSLLMHIKPAVGAPRPVGEAIVEHLFPDPTMVVSLWLVFRGAMAKLQWHTLLPSCSRFLASIRDLPAVMEFISTAGRLAKVTMPDGSRLSEHPYESLD